MSPSFTVEYLETIAMSRSPQEVFDLMWRLNSFTPALFGVMAARSSLAPSVRASLVALCFDWLSE